MESIVSKLPKYMSFINMDKMRGFVKIHTNNIWNALKYMENKYDLAYIDNVKYDKDNKTLIELSFKIRFQFNKETKACLIILALQR